MLHITNIILIARRQEESQDVRNPLAVSALDIIYGKIGLDNSIVITGIRDLNSRCFYLKYHEVPIN